MQDRAFDIQETVLAVAEAKNISGYALALA
jgi:hypothetical protein